VTYFTLSFGDAITRIYLRGDKSAVKDPEGSWTSAKELEATEGPGRFVGFIIRAFIAPAAQAAELVDAASELKNPAMRIRAK